MPTRQELRHQLLTYLHTLVNGQPELVVSPQEVSEALGVTPEAIGQQLSALKFGYRKVRVPGAHFRDIRRVNMRVLPVKDLPALAPDPPPPRSSPAPPAPPAAPKTDPQWEARSRSRLVQTPGLATHCGRCYATLPSYLQPVGVCGDCLMEQEQRQPLRRIPGPQYGRIELVVAAQTAAQQSRYWGTVPGPGYGRNHDQNGEE
jgi:hypothetical protein